MLNWVGLWLWGAGYRYLYSLEVSGCHVWPDSQRQEWNEGNGVGVNGGKFSCALYLSPASASNQAWCQVEIHHGCTIVGLWTDLSDQSVQLCSCRSPQGQ